MILVDGTESHLSWRSSFLWLFLPSPPNPSSLLASKGIFLNYSSAHFVGVAADPISAHCGADLRSKRGASTVHGATEPSEELSRCRVPDLTPRASGSLSLP